MSAVTLYFERDDESLIEAGRLIERLGLTARFERSCRESVDFDGALEFETEDDAMMFRLGASFTVLLASEIRAAREQRLAASRQHMQDQIDRLDEVDPAEIEAFMRGLLKAASR